MHNEGDQNSYFSLNTTRITTFRMRLPGHIECIGMKRSAYKTLVGRTREKDY
jgi:hypothetical protein